MSITKLQTHEGVPIGRENFEEYTSYLSSLVARSNPFIETTVTDFNDIVVIGEGQTVVGSTDSSVASSVTINNVGAKSSFFSYKFPDTSFTTEQISHGNVQTTTSLAVTPTAIVAGEYVFRIEVSKTDDSSTRAATAQLSVNATPVGNVFSLNSSEVLDVSYFYTTTTLAPGDTVTLGVTDVSGTGGLDYVVTVYKYEPWQQDQVYLMNYKVIGSIFTAGLVGRLNVYYGNEDAIDYDDIDASSFELIDTVALSANNDTLGAILFRPDQTYTKGVILFSLENSAEYDALVPVEIEGRKLDPDALIALSGSSANSFAFLTDDKRELYAFATNLVEPPTATPGIKFWELPMSSISEIYIEPTNIKYGITKDLLPPTFSSFSSTDYVAAKENTLLGAYEKGIVLTFVNGIPQVDDAYSPLSNFYDVSSLSSSDMVLLSSFRLGAEYPKPVYTRRENHQYADQILKGFSHINSNTSSFAESLANPNFDNTLTFPHTDFLLNPSLILIYQSAVDDSLGYYYIPRDNEFNRSGAVKKNHYKVLDPSAGVVKFNFSLTELSNLGDRFWIVSAEQLHEATVGTLTEYFSKEGNLYSPTANLDVSTTVLSFDPNLLVDTDLESTLPAVPVIPSTKITSSSGGSIISDAEGEFSRYVLLAISYPGRMSADEVVRSQASKYEPDVLSFAYYPYTAASEVVTQSKPYPVYIQLIHNQVSWYNRGINGLIFDPVYRAVRSGLHVVANTSTRPVDGVTLGSLRRRSTLSSLAGTIAPGDTTFVRGIDPNTFLVGNAFGQIDSVLPSPGSLLVGASGSPPVNLPRGAPKQALLSTDTGIYWGDVSTAAWTRLDVTTQFSTDSVWATDNTTLAITGATDQIMLTVTEQITVSDVITNLDISLTSDVVIHNLTVTSSVDLPSTGVTPGIYGSSSSIPTFDVGADGRLVAATDVSINTNAWTTISDGTNSITAGITEGLRVRGVTNQTTVTVGSVSTTDTLTIALSTDVVINGYASAPTFRFPHQVTPPPVVNGNMWSTASDVSIVVNNVVRKFAFGGANGHTHDAADIISGVLHPNVGGTGNSSYLNGQLLIGNTSTGGLNKSTLNIGGGLTIQNGAGTINLSTTATSSSTPNAIVSRNGDGDFSANTITANLAGNASTATALQTARTINNVTFDGTQNVSVPTVNTLSTGLGLSSSGSFNGLVARTFSVNPAEVVMIAGAQTILGAKTFTTIILPVKT